MRLSDTYRWAKSTIKNREGKVSWNYKEKPFHTLKLKRQTKHSLEWVATVISYTAGGVIKSFWKSFGCFFHKVNHTSV